MSRKRVERAQFHGELLGVLREQVVVLRRIAAVMERDRTVGEIESRRSNSRRYSEPPLLDDTLDEPRWFRCVDASLAGVVLQTSTQPPVIIVGQYVYRAGYRIRLYPDADRVAVRRYPFPGGFGEAMEVRSKLKPPVGDWTLMEKQ